MRVIFRGRGNIWCWRVTSVAPRIVLDVSYVTRINHEGHCSCQGQYLIEYPTRVPNTQIRFRWTSCRRTMHQTLITDKGRPKNRYPYQLSVLVCCAKPVGLSIVSLQSLRPFGGHCALETSEFGGMNLYWQTDLN